ncbi:SURF1 family protein [Alcanivorax sp. DP30]|uniref:SURF1 family protein n=2 Tax=unclassified Alcanivorax TaxID=2638842 RepID=UPI001F3E56DC|nr:SURF1 family protein [Alcanivorax sp. DP30]
MARRRFLSFLFLLLAAVAFAGFMALGVWQVKRLAWKEDLIARVDARVHAEPVAAPVQRGWPEVSEATHEYLHVLVRGEYRADAVSLVAAATEEGQGYWVMAPLQQEDGSWVYINQGFVPQAQREAAQSGTFTPEGVLTVTGLLRLGHPGGGVLRDNVPAENRWYSRDVEAMAATQGLSPVAPYFIDASATQAPLPVGGLTVIRFPNNHLVYAITWFALALGVVLAVVLVFRHR